MQDKKDYLKALAATIRSQKHSHIECQRTIQSQKLFGYDFWRERKAVYVERGFKYANDHSANTAYRHHHIAYCMFRGTPYEQIERPAKGHEPNMKLIETIIQELRDGCAAEQLVTSDEQTVRPD